VFPASVCLWKKTHTNLKPKPTEVLPVGMRRTEADPIISQSTHISKHYTIHCNIYNLYQLINLSIKETEITDELLFHVLSD
jgi:hypothetical protein